MCGIVGYVGTQSALEVALDGLRRLEYRGYDSAGIALLGDTGGPDVAAGESAQPPIVVRRRAGKLANLEKLLGDEGPLPTGRHRHRAHPVGDPWRTRPTGTPTRTWTAPDRSR